jgi:hypothetical protein
VIHQQEHVSWAHCCKEREEEPEGQLKMDLPTSTLPTSAGQRATNPGSHALPSLVRGLVVRFLYESVYHLRQVVRVLPADGQHPVRLGVHTPSSPGDTSGGTLRLISLEAVSRQNMLQDDGGWTAMGADEAARLQAWLLAEQRTLPLHEVRGLP